MSTSQFLVQNVYFITKGTVTGALYGIIFTMYILCVLSLCPQLGDQHHRKQNLFTLSCMTLTMICAIISLAIEARDLEASFVENADFPGGGIFYSVAIFGRAPIAVVSYVMKDLLDLSTAGVQARLHFESIVHFDNHILWCHQIWRVWIIFRMSQYRQIIWIAPSLALLAYLGIQIFTIVIIITSAGMGSPAIPIIYGGKALILFISLYATAMIISKIALTRRRHIKILDGYCILPPSSGAFLSLLHLEVPSLLIDLHALLLPASVLQLALSPCLTYLNTMILRPAYHSLRLIKILHLEPLSFRSRMVSRSQSFSNLSRFEALNFTIRIFLSPLCQYSSENGFVSPWHMAHLGGIISRGPGLSFVEATAVLPEGRISPEDVGLWSDAHIEGLSKIVEFAHSQSQKIGIQLAHAGRKASTFPPFIANPSPTASSNPRERGWPDDVWGPSTKPFIDSYPHPKELTKEGIQRITHAFKDAAVRAVKAGFDVVEIHSAHGYLLSSFLSPSSNLRTDEYGGSFENRIRMLVEIVDVVRSVIPQTMPLLVRVSGTEWLEQVAPDEPQWRPKDTARLAPILADHGVDLLDVSSGGLSPRQRVVPGEAYQAHLAAAVKKAVGDKLVVSAVGALGNGPIAQKVLESGQADVVFVGRQFQKNPGLVWQMADELGVEIVQAKQIGWGFKGRAKQALGHGEKQKL
ncbi:hypothetical protein NP233_g5542 [Leucocoprinus birnbaumii]|uniref:NADH:flavin oxidoreductase/NADH oxidase N-terminal domain-containing protein n=1 Tax=Leucocoprinus birnbaumii TaxID=56174 RepID=A0AAD5VT23_9AGAR|nr:hypothetical protein NP233_g5542 [Leucocoprinus birnbaumii]